MGWLVSGQEVEGGGGVDVGGDPFVQSKTAGEARDLFVPGCVELLGKEDEAYTPPLRDSRLFFMPATVR